MIRDIDTPAGGVKVIYQAVAALRRHGIAAFVVAPPRAPAWLAGSEWLRDVRVIDVGQSASVGADDIIVYHDGIGAHRVPAMMQRPERSVIWFQNHNALRVNVDIDWAALRHIRALTVSDYSANALGDFGFRRVDTIAPPVDRDVFRPGAKRHRIAYMPRKWPGLAERLRSQFDASIEWHAIDGAGEAATAAALAEASIFLNLGRAEGFGLPPLEAMAAGCVVCGFAGEGTGDFATAANGFWAEEGDVAGCAGAIAAAIAVFSDEARIAALREAGRRTAERYALTVFERRMADYFRALL